MQMRRGRYITSPKRRDVSRIISAARRRKKSREPGPARRDARFRRVIHWPRFRITRPIPLARFSVPLLALDFDLPPPGSQILLTFRTIRRSDRDFFALLCFIALLSGDLSSTTPRRGSLDRSSRDVKAEGRSAGSFNHEFLCIFVFLKIALRSRIRRKLYFAVCFVYSLENFLRVQKNSHSI